MRRWRPPGNRVEAIDHVMVPNLMASLSLSEEAAEEYPVTASATYAGALVCVAAPLFFNIHFTDKVLALFLKIKS